MDKKNAGLTLGILLGVLLLLSLISVFAMSNRDDLAVSVEGDDLSFIEKMDFMKEHDRQNMNDIRKNTNEIKDSDLPLTSFIRSRVNSMIDFEYYHDIIDDSKEKFDKSMDFVSIKMGGESPSFKERELRLIKTSEEWEEWWGKHFPGQQMMNVNFDGNMVIVAFMGEKTTGGYSIEITDVKKKSGRLYIMVEEQLPGEGCMTLLSYTHPHHMVSVEKTNLPEHFEVKETVVSCT